jgi:hypothetical protein
MLWTPPPFVGNIVSRSWSRTSFESESLLFIALVTVNGIYTASRFFECARRPLIIRLTAIPKNNNIS